MEQQDGIVGFVVYKDMGGAQDMEVLRGDTGTVVLFADYKAAKGESGWFDVVAPITQKRWEELGRPKARSVGGSCLISPTGGKRSR